MKRPLGARPRLAILSDTIRADLHEQLVSFRRLEVWHFYHYSSSDIPPEAFGKRCLRFRNPFHLVLQLLRLRPDVIQGSEPYHFPRGFVICVAALIGAKLLRIPYYFPMLENIPPETKFDIRKWGVPLRPLITPLVKRFLRLYGAGAGLVFALNHGARQSLREVGVNEDSISSHLYATWGVDLDLFSPRRDGREPALGRNAVLFVGRLLPLKGIRYLLEAFVEVWEALPDARLFIIGEGSLAEEIPKFAARHSLSSAVQLVGPVLNCNLPPYFRAARVVASPSVTTPRWAEQVGMVNIQSMACGTPVVSTTSGSIAEFVDNGATGILVPERDSHALAEAIIRLLTDAVLHQRVSAAARAAAERRYDASRNVAEAEEVILGLLGSVEGS